MNIDAVRLVARREIRERLRARSFRVTVVISMLAVATAVVLPKVLAGSHHAERIGVVGVAVPVGVATSLGHAVNRTITIVEVPDAATARSLVRSSRLDLALVDNTVVVRVQPQPTDSGLTARLAYALATALGQQSAYRAAGLTPAQITRVGGAQALPISGLLPNPADRTRQKATTFAGILLLYSFISLYGTWLLYGVVEEKSSRVVEILLATLRPTELLAGKIVGIGALGITQGLAVATTAFVASAASGSNVLSGSRASTVIQMLGWLVLGYAFYSALYTAGGSLVGRQEEAANVQFPIGLPLLIAYLTTATSFGSTSPSTFMVALSFFPPTAPIAMPARLAYGTVPVWQVALSVALLLAGTVVVVRFAASVYNRAILHTGTRLSWAKVLRSPV